MMKLAMLLIVNEAVVDPVSVVTRKLKNTIKRRIRRNSERSIGKKPQCSEKSVRNAIKVMEMKSVGLSKTFLLTYAGKKKIRDGCKGILNLLKTKGLVKGFIDEKIFRVDRAANSLSHRITTSGAVSAGTWKTFRTKNPSSIMVCCAIGDDGSKAPINVFPKAKPLICTNHYLKILAETMILGSNNIIYINGYGYVMVRLGWFYQYYIYI